MRVAQSITFTHRHRTAIWRLCAAIFLALLAGTDASAAQPITPDKVIELFNGRDLSGFYTFLLDTKHDDPRHVFTVHDGLLHISGDGLGYLATKHTYRDYHLIVECRWGERTWGPRKSAAKDSGILLHATGTDGNARSWMASIECQIIEGGMGDFIVVPGTEADGSPVPMALTCEVENDRDGEPCWHKGASRQTFRSGRINWYARDPDWQDTLGYRGQNDIKDRGDEWTTIEVFCKDNHITNKVNGVVVNEGFDSEATSGKLLFQSEYAEIFFRKIELRPLVE